MANSYKDYLERRRDNIKMDFYDWKEKCCTDLMLLDPFTKSANELFVKTRMTVNHYNDIPTLKSWLVQDYDEDYQLSCHQAVYINNKTCIGMHKIFDVSELPLKYGFGNVAMYKTHKIQHFKLLFYVLSVIYFLTLSTILPYLLSLFLLVLILYLLTFLNDKRSIDTDYNIPLELLDTLEYQGFTFQWRPRYKGKKIMLWYDKEGCINLHCAKEEITKEEKSTFLHLFEGRDFNIRNKPYTILYYKLHMNKDGKYSIYPLYNSHNMVSFNTILFDDHDFTLDFNSTEYTETLNWLKYNKSQYKGFYLCAVKNNDFNYLAKVKLSYPNQTVTLEDNLPWVQELVINNMSDECELNDNQREHATRLQAYLKKVAQGHKNQLLILFDLKEDPIEYTNYLLANIPQLWLREYLSHNTPPQAEDYYEFICEVLASIREQKDNTYLEHLQGKNLYWFHQKRRVHI